MKPNINQEERSKIPDGLGYGSEQSNGNSNPEGGDGGGDKPKPKSGSSDELSDLANEMNESMGNSSDDPFEDAFSWGEGKSENEDQPTDEDEPTETAEGEDEEEEDATVEDDTAEDSEEDQEEVEVSEEESEGEEESEESEEPEIFYDAKRDFPDLDIDPTTYKSRVDLNEGFAAKVRYLSELRDQLSERDSGLGAIQLPELTGNSEEFLNQPADREMFSSQDADTAKKTVAELDQAIKRAKSKIDRIDTQRKREKKVQQVSEEYKEGVQNLVSAVDAFGIDRSEAERMSIPDLLQQADQHLKDLQQGDKGQQIIDEHGLPEYNRRIEQLRAHRQSIQKFPSIHEKQQKLNEGDDDKSTGRNQSASPEQIEGWFKEFREDNPNLDMFQAPTVEPEKAFRDYVNSRIIRDGYKMTSPRDFISLHRDYQAMLKKQSEKYGKSKASTEKAKSTKENKAGEDRADKSGKKKPPVHKIKNNNNDQGDRLTTKDIDKEFESLAEELNSVASRQ